MSPGIPACGKKFSKKRDTVAMQRRLEFVTVKECAYFHCVTLSEVKNRISLSLSSHFCKSKNLPLNRRSNYIKIKHEHDTSCY